MSRSLAGGRQESIRTSSTAMLPAGDPVVKRITERASYLTGYPYANIEPLQLVKYTAGQRYEPHFDYGEACDFEENMGKGHRHVTMLVYLNNLPAGAGGHTPFPKLNVQVDPVEVRHSEYSGNPGAILAQFWRNSLTRPVAPPAPGRRDRLQRLPAQRRGGPAHAPRRHAAGERHQDRDQHLDPRGRVGGAAEGRGGDGREHRGLLYVGS